MTCFICLRTGKKVFNINLPCGKGQNTIKADIIEFVGDKSIAAYLTDDHNCCSVCMNVLDDIVRYKDKLVDQIMKRNLTQPDLGRIWNFVAKSEAKSEFKEKSDPMSHLRSVTSPLSSRASTPSIYYVKKTKSYDNLLEKEVERRESYKRDMQHYARQCAAKKIDLATREKYLIKSKSKKMKRDIVNNFSRNMYDRPVSSASELSCVSYMAEEKRQPPQPVKRKIIYDGDEIVFPLKRTRSVSRSHQENVHEREKKKALLDGQQLEDTMDTCEVCKCSCFRNMDIYTAHMVQVHGLSGRFGCKYCDNQYLTKEHLAYHISKTHRNSIACPICKTINPDSNSETFASHMEQHIKELYACRFCNKPFDTKENLNEHIFTKHKRKRLFYTKNEVRILSNCTYKPEVVENKTPRKYKWIDYGNVLEKDEVGFKPSTWQDCDYEDQDEETFERLTGTPDSEGSMYEYKGIPPKNTISRKCGTALRPGSSLSLKSTSSSGYYTNFSKGGRNISGESGRSTPWSVVGGEEDQEVMRAMNNQTPFDLGSVRDLESRNTEVAEILAGEEDEYDPQSYEDSAEEVDRESNSDDMDIMENQYLVNNSFVSSINYTDAEL
ncbi:unnamed protein product [Ceutorhynchus assimilis]|uniref:C2H2-type domain-containing protein n=1 Tax=Ceutorhynchus assimilis TaxID=467358 RepID=A0A9N9MIK9_9CUCU|nr:unnamed protein product [Ceutorhynchus assimilis]